MAMFDDVDKKLSGWFNAGAEKAKGMSETLRLSNAIREEETKQAELYRQMGLFCSCSGRKNERMVRWR